MIRTPGKGSQKGPGKETFPHKITIKTASSELLDKVSRIETLIQQLNNTQDQLDMVQRELRYSYRLQKGTTVGQTPYYLTLPQQCKLPHAWTKLRGRSQHFLLYNSANRTIIPLATTERRGSLQSNKQSILCVCLISFSNFLYMCVPVSDQNQIKL